MRNRQPAAHRAATPRAVTRITRRLFTRRRGTVRETARRSDRGFVCAFIDGRWLGGWYDTSFATVSVVLGGVTACALRVKGLPSRFEALYLLYRLGHARQ